MQKYYDISMTGFMSAVLRLVGTLLFLIQMALINTQAKKKGFGNFSYISRINLIMIGFFKILFFLLYLIIEENGTITFFCIL